MSFRFYDKEIKKVLGRKRLNLICKCSDIYFVFNKDDNGDCIFPVDDLIGEIVQDERRRALAQKNKNAIKKEDWVHDVDYDIPHVAFAIGYVLGLSYEPGQPEIKRAVGVIERIIKKESLLPYLRRERKTA